MNVDGRCGLLDVGVVRVVVRRFSVHIRLLDSNRVGVVRQKEFAVGRGLAPFIANWQNRLGFHEQVIPSDTDKSLQALREGACVCIALYQRGAAVSFRKLNVVVSRAAHRGQASERQPEGSNQYLSRIHCKSEAQIDSMLSASRGGHLIYLQLLFFAIESNLQTPCAISNKPRVWLIRVLVHFQVQTSIVHITCLHGLFCS